MTSVFVETATLTASREGSLGCKQADASRSGIASAAQLIDAAHKGGAGFLRRSSISVDTKVYPNLAQAASGTGGSSGGGGASGQVVVYTLSYEQPAMVVGKLLGRPKYTHRNIITIKNEPFERAEGNASACG
jgi:hypothetical protein